MKTFLLLVSVLLVAPVAHAQFGFGDLGKALDKAKSIAKMAKGAAGLGPEEEKVIGESVALEIVGKYGGLVKTPSRRSCSASTSSAGPSPATRPARSLNWRFAVLDSRIGQRLLRARWLRVHHPRAL